MSETPENIPQSAQELRGIVDRIARLEEEKRETSDAIKDIYTEAKFRGYNQKALRTLVKRKIETPEQRAKREADAADLEMMEAALGTYISTPLGEAAARGRR